MKYFGKQSRDEGRKQNIWSVLELFCIGGIVLTRNTPASKVHHGRDVSLKEQGFLVAQPLRR